jgi:hypothetical protein
MSAPQRCNGCGGFAMVDPVQTIVDATIDVLTGLDMLQDFADRMPRHVPTDEDNFSQLDWLILQIQREARRISAAGEALISKDGGAQ